MTSKKTTERLKAIQRRFGIDDDGMLGPDTLTRIESLLDASLGVKKADQTYSLTCSRKGLEQIVFFEISSPAYYKRFLSHPTWPKGYSGITIGIGYDLGYQSKTQIKKDWQGKISDTELDQLIDVAGLKGESAHVALSSVKLITISLAVASDVHCSATLPKYAEKTKKAYPGVELLPADAQSMLLSLVFNRGTKMTGPSRREMKAIQALVVEKDLNGIAHQMTRMKRLWDEDQLPGLHIRRDKEADMIAHARSEYEPGELIRV
ncbi:MAG: pesticin C-terminus-like muramidase [Mariprofundus sp.]|nr:pesticin C-terminus-like muramidase [Mariprofundus sp.]